MTVCSEERIRYLKNKFIFHMKSQPAEKENKLLFGKEYVYFYPDLS